MPIDDSAARRTSEFFRLLDAKDEAGLRAQWVDAPQATDEITRGWLRGRIPLEDYFQDSLPHLSDIHSSNRRARCAHMGRCRGPDLRAAPDLRLRRAANSDRRAHDDDLAPRGRQLEGRAVPFDSAFGGVVGPAPTQTGGTFTAATEGRWQGSAA